MDELPYFFGLLKENEVITTAVRKKRLDVNDLDGLKYKQKAHEIRLTNFCLDKQVKFKMVKIFFSNFGVLIDFISPDSKYFVNSKLYFNTQSVAKRKPPYIINNKAYNVKSKRLVNVELFDREVQGSVLQSDLYGCKIMLSFC
jgi:hypothetical protein